MRFIYYNKFNILCIRRLLHFVFSRTLSPKAQAVLNRLSPEQRQMALMEANRLRDSVGSKNDNGKFLLQNEDTTVDKFDSSDFERIR